MKTTRRTFLQSSAATLALPWLDSLNGFAHAVDAKTPPKRLLMICLPLGIYKEALVPEERGANYKLPEYLELIKDYRSNITVFSGLDHPGVTGGHGAEPRIFTGIPSNKRNFRSLDQYIASKIGQNTRMDSLVISAGRNEFSWTDSGTLVPAQSKMATVYNQLFGQEDSTQVNKKLEGIHQGKRIMDLAQRQAKALQPSLSDADQKKLSEYFEAVGETERRLIKSEQWVHTPKPKVDLPIPTDPTDRAEIQSQLRNVCDISHLAFQTDSTRVITFGYFEQNKVNVAGVQNAYHALSHHGKDPGNVKQLKLIESVFFKELNRLLGKLQSTREGNGTLLDNTTILLSSNLGNGSNHSNKDLPTLLIGGNFNHGQHLAFEPSTVPLSNLFVSILNQFGIADKTFGMATGPLDGLEIG
jgi:hypothetical protein